MAVLHLISGLPGSGKTTKAKEISEVSPVVRMSPDEWMRASGIPLRDSASRELIEQFQFELTLTLLAQGLDVVIEWGTWSRSERIKILIATKERGHLVKGYFLSPTLQDLRQRLDIRDRELPETDQVSVGELEAIAKMFENPESEEISMYSEVWFDNASTGRVTPNKGLRG